MLENSLFLIPLMIQVTHKLLSSYIILAIYLQRGKLLCSHCLTCGNVETFQYVMSAD